MADMKYIMACLCGHEEECQPEDQRLGSVWKCGGCGAMTACVRPRIGGKVWINIQKSDAEFHCLFEEPEDA